MVRGVEETRDEYIKDEREGEGVESYFLHFFVSFSLNCKPSCCLISVTRDSDFGSRFSSEFLCIWVITCISGIRAVDSRRW